MSVWIALLITQRFHRLQLRRGSRRVESGKKADQYRGYGNDGGVQQVGSKRNIRDGIYVRSQMDEVIFVGDKTDDMTHDQTEEGSNDSDNHSLPDEDPANLMRCCAHRKQDRNITGLFEDHHGQHGDDVERSHKHDQSNREKHHDSLELQRSENGSIEFLPIRGIKMFLTQLLDQRFTNLRSAIQIFIPDLPIDGWDNAAANSHQP